MGSAQAPVAVLMNTAKRREFDLLSDYQILKKYSASCGYILTQGYLLTLFTLKCINRTAYRYSILTFLVRNYVFVFMRVAYC
jgi:hypothetical protein